MFGQPLSAHLTRNCWLFEDFFLLQLRLSPSLDVDINSAVHVLVRRKSGEMARPCDHDMDLRNVRKCDKCVNRITRYGSCALSAFIRYQAPPYGWRLSHARPNEDHLPQGRGKV